ncbi:MAG: hypothetical protein ACOC54_05650 [Candidatus Sumerlaeota bacterium]
MPNILRKAIQELISDYQNYIAQESEDQKRLEEKLVELEKSRDQNFQKVAEDNTDDEAQQRLDEDDSGIAKLKKEIAALKRRRTRKTQDLRAKLLQSQEESLKELTEHLETLHKEQKHFKTVLIPELEEYLTNIKDQLKENEETIESVHKEIARLNQLDLDTILYQQST